MPEIKRTFTAGKMNKDLDERLVRNGEYRDALNIQVRTTDGDSSGVGDAGTVQNIEGNVSVGFAYSIVGYDGNATKIIGNVNDEKNDKAYFFAAAPTPESGIVDIAVSDIIEDGERVWVDSIIEVDTSSNPTPQLLPEQDPGQAIFVDRFAVTQTWEEVGSPNPSDGVSTYQSFSVADASKYRIGMRVYAQREDGTHILFEDEDQTIPGVEIINIVGNTLYLASEQIVTVETAFDVSIAPDFPTCKVMKFVHPERVLEFDYNKILSGINIIDNLLFWTDAKTGDDRKIYGNEPKKINIDRSRAGTTAWDTHTQLIVSDASNNNELVPITQVENITNADVKLEHITVIRKKPISPPTLSLRDTERAGSAEFYITSGLNFSQNGNLAVPGETVTVTLPEDNLDIRENDVLTFTTSGVVINWYQTPIKIKTRVTDTNVNGNPLLIEVTLITVHPDLTINELGPWFVTLKQPKPLFETKFGRFAYRYKYEDGEYSAFSPWSELAFLPGDFLYLPSKGYNKGMVNNLRELIIRDFIPDDTIRPSDVKTVDILWKTTDNANVYVIKSITREINSEWELFTDNNVDNTGSITITSEIIERAIPSNQILRGWDNVPKTAVAQEITGSRLVYGNYTQGYDINTPVGLKQSILNNEVLNLQGTKSVKSLRNYKWGMVFGDKYGRETPVISSGYLTGALAEGDTVTGDISLSKELAQYANRFKLLQTWEDNGAEPEEWMEYVKYYVKETSAEYYNLVMDRWYDAEDGNIWLSFPSVDRNKIDDETYLILKNQHGSQEPVLDEARYRVIAIENEAPDYIKTERRKLAPFKISMQDVYEGTNVTSPESTNPKGLIDRTTIKLANSALETGPDNLTNINITNLDFKGTKKARIVAHYQPGGDDTKIYKVEGPIRTVTKFEQQNITINDIGVPASVTIEEPWTASEVNMYFKVLYTLSASLSSTLTTNVANIEDESNAHVIKYFLQFEDWVVENKPQFDGRFFAKVEVDNILRGNLLNEADGGYVSDGVFDLAYIANKANNPAVSGTFANKAWGLNADDETVDSVFTSSNVESSFGDDGNANNTLTEAFWNWWGDAESGVGTSKIFIDETPVASDYGFSLLPTTISQVYDPTTEEMVTFNFQEALLAAGITGDTMINELQPGITQPSGLYTGVNYDESDPNNITQLNGNGTITHFTISTLGDTFENGQNQVFKNKMQTDGQLFRFPNDPNGHIYRVKRPTLITEDIDLDSLNDAFGNNEGGNDLFWGAWNADIGITVGEFNFDNLSNINYITNDNTDNYFSKRSSFIVRFTRVDPDTNQDNEFGEGIIDLDEFDPRGQVAHNGIGTFSIEFIKKESEVALLEDDIVTNNACWETEPKKDIDVDIYYEATGGIPMKLDTLGNMQVYTGAANFRPRASKVVFDRRLVLDEYSQETITETIILTGVPFARKVYPNSTVSIWKSGQNNADVLLTPTITPSTATAVGIGINDEIAFKHKNDLVTRAKVVDHMDIVDYQGLPQLTNSSERITVNGGSATSVILQGGETAGGVLFQGNDQDLITTDLIGYNVLPDVGINNGTFVTGVVDLGYGMQITINKPVQSGYTGTFTFVKVTGYYRLDVDTWKYAIDPNWFNCYSFGNGVESDRIRDDFNAPQIDNGFRASSKFLEYGEEHIGSGIIHSGLYNAISSVNSLNEFNMAEKITKNLNPAYGSIQAFKTRDTNLLTFCEDKVLTVLSNKDAVFNADGNPQLVATNRVLGTATPFIGDYGISKNPESLASDQYRAYFADKQRGAVLRLSNDGLTPISSVGMTTYFRENLRLCNDLIGSFDMVNGEYNLTLDIKPENVSATTSKTTISFNEGSKGWVSFKSFIPSCGGSVSGKYLTAQKNGVWEHYANSTRNNFYGSQYSSTIDVLFNDIPDSVKSFKAINYEGSQSKIDESHDIANETVEDASGNIISSFDGEYYNLSQKAGWHVTGFNTDLQEGQVNEFINKENKWFNYINGVETTSSNIDTSEFSVQGIGFPSSSLYSSGENNESELIIQEEEENEEGNEEENEEEFSTWAWAPLAISNLFIQNVAFQVVNQVVSVTGGIPPYTWTLEANAWTGPIPNQDLVFETMTGTFDSSIAPGPGVVPYGQVTIQSIPIVNAIVKITDSQGTTVNSNPYNNMGSQNI